MLRLNGMGRLVCQSDKAIAPCPQQRPANRTQWRRGAGDWSLQSRWQIAVAEAGRELAVTDWWSRACCGGKAELALDSRSVSMARRGVSRTLIDQDLPNVPPLPSDEKEEKLDLPDVPTKASTEDEQGERN
nr:vacuolar protein sorting-associated protein 20 homolog 2 [Ipomoea batatas]